MGDLLKQFGSLTGTAFAGACCAGATAVLSAVTAVGAGFLINDAILIPLFAAFLALSLWLLYGSARAHGDSKPFWLGVAGAAAALGGLFIATVLIYSGIVAMVAGSLWDFQNGRRKAACASV